METAGAGEKKIVEEEEKEEEVEGLDKKMPHKLLTAQNISIGREGGDKLRGKAGGE